MVEDVALIMEQGVDECVGRLIKENELTSATTSTTVLHRCSSLQSTAR